MGSLILCALLFGFGFETSYTAPLANPQHPTSHHTTTAINNNDKSGAFVRKSRVAICVVLIDGHIKAHKAYGTNDVKNAIDAEAFVDSVGVLRHAFTELPVCPTRQERSQRFLSHTHTKTIIGYVGRA